jgi:phosphoribosylformylglycinamidine cyclo-ligase
MQRVGDIPESEMLRTFNCGLGMIAIARADNAESVIAQLQAAGEQAFAIGALTTATGSERVAYTNQLHG